MTIKPRHIAIIAAATAVITLAAVTVWLVRRKNRTAKNDDMKTTSEKGLKIIKEFEGYRSTAYQCAAGVWTIGYGHTTGVKQGDTCTKAQAEAWLADDLHEPEAAINVLRLTLSQNQFDALASLAFNIGASALARSTLLKKAKANSDDPTIADEFLRWNKVGNTPMTGLTRRRKAEAELYFT